MRKYAKYLITVLFLTPFLLHADLETESSENTMLRTSGAAITYCVQGQEVTVIVRTGEAIQQYVGDSC